MASRKNNGANNGAPPGLPTAQQAQLIAEAILRLRAQRFNMELQRDANGADNGDELPDRPGRTYADDFAELDAAEERITKKHEKLMPLVNGLISGGG